MASPVSIASLPSQRALLVAVALGMLLPLAATCVRAEPQPLAQPQSWLEELQQLNEREREAFERLNQQHKQDTLERQQMESYRQGQEHIRQQVDNQRLQTIRGHQ